MATSKTQMRKQIAVVLQSLSNESISTQSEAVTKKVLTHPRYQASKRVSIYLSIAQEINTESILRDLFQRGKSVFIPRFDKNEMRMVRLASMDDYRLLPTTTWNIKQPKLEEQREDALTTGPLDLILVPGVAFTQSGKRLGHGKGHYDKFFAQHKTIYGFAPYSIALALREQIVDDLETTERDHIINEIIYDKSS